MHLIALQDGRKVQVEEYGDPAGVPALWFHGAFSSRLEAGCLDAPARELGLRVLSLDRPGVGGTDPLPGRTVTGYADDVREVLDAFEIEQAAVGGLSNGGMYAMAVASRIPQRVLRAVPYNSSTPLADRAARAALSRKARLSYAYLLRHTDRLDAKVSRKHRFAAAAAEVLRQDVQAYLRTEVALCTSPWGFDHRAVPGPTVVVSGERDAGLGYAKVWAQELPQGRLVLVPGGHGGMPAPVVSRRLVELLAGRP